MAKFEKDLIRLRVEEVAHKEADLPPNVAKDIAFHMTDWLDDLTALFKFCEHPSELSNDQIHKILMCFLVHVPNHLAAASKLYTGNGIKDVFDVGVLQDDD